MQGDQPSWQSWGFNPQSPPSHHPSRSTTSPSQLVLQVVYVESADQLEAYLFPESLSVGPGFWEGLWKRRGGKGGRGASRASSTDAGSADGVRDRSVLHQHQHPYQASRSRRPSSLEKFGRASRRAAEGDAL